MSVAASLLNAEYLCESLRAQIDFTIEEITTGQMARRYVTGTGQVLGNTHPLESACLRRGCVIHCPSDHSMKDFPTHWREDRRLMERICPHGIGHPDPDTLMYIFETFGSEASSNESVHGCDGCCHGAYNEAIYGDD